MRQTHVIVGSGLAGVTAAATLRAEGFDGRVVLVGDESHLPYPRPPLSKAVVRGELPAERLFLRPAAWYASKDIELLSGVTATGLDPAARTLALGDGAPLRYDRLLLATGGRPRMLPGSAALPGVYALRSLDDAVAIRDRLGPGRSLLVIGAGFLGAELAASARSTGTAVTVLEAAPRPLARSLPPLLSRVYTRIHRERGVDLRAGVGIERLVTAGGGVRAIGTDGKGYPADGPADTVAVAVGIHPNMDPAAAAGLWTGNGILVDEFCRTSAPEIYAAGDVANHPNAVLGGRVRLEHWQNAQHQAAAAARNMLGRRSPFAEVPWVWSDQYDLNLQVTGFAAPDDTVVVRGDVESRDFTAFLLRDGLLTGAVGINRADDVRAARRLIQQGRRPEPALLADEDGELEALLTPTTIP
jgi:3-phenylpropionate/trans-cinnamate dioxygenase ferredoxin reductase subunit